MWRGTASVCMPRLGGTTRAEIHGGVCLFPDLLAYLMQLSPLRRQPYSQTYYLQAPSLRHQACSRTRFTVGLSFITIQIGCLTVLIMLKKPASHIRVLFEIKIFRKNSLAS
jgi:hypothetical protein